MFYRHSFDKLLYPLLAMLLLLAVSYRPKYRLQTEMPKTFFSGSGEDRKGPQMPLERKIAWAYWESAQMNIQWKYPHGTTLPGDPPPEFRIEAAALGPGATDPTIRAFYWKRLQQVWLLPEAWNQRYEFSLDWASDPFTSIGQWLRDRADQWFTIH